MVSRYEAPHPTVVTVVSVVTHGEVVAGGNITRHTIGVIHALFVKWKGKCCWDVGKSIVFDEYRVLDAHQRLGKCLRIGKCLRVEIVAALAQRNRGAVYG